MALELNATVAATFDERKSCAFVLNAFQCHLPSRAIFHTPKSRHNLLQRETTRWSSLLCTSTPAHVISDNKFIFNFASSRNGGTDRVNLASFNRALAPLVLGFCTFHVDARAFHRDAMMRRFKAIRKRERATNGDKMSGHSLNRARRI